MKSYRVRAIGSWTPRTVTRAVGVASFATKCGTSKILLIQRYGTRLYALLVDKSPLWRALAGLAASVMLLAALACGSLEVLNPANVPTIPLENTPPPDIQKTIAAAVRATRQAVSTPTPTAASTSTPDPTALPTQPPTATPRPTPAPTPTPLPKLTTPAPAAIPRSMPTLEFVYKAVDCGLCYPKDVTLLEWEIRSDQAGNVEIVGVVENASDRLAENVTVSFYFKDFQGEELKGYNVAYGSNSVRSIEPGKKWKFRAVPADDVDMELVSEVRVTCRSYASYDAAILSFCQSSAHKQIADPTMRAIAEPPTPTSGLDGGEGMVRVPAPIESIDLEVIESDPSRHSLVVQSGLTSGCARYDGYTVYREAGTIYVVVTSLVPPDQTLCTQVYRTVESRIPLGSELEPNTEYTAQVNGGVVIVTQGDGGPSGALDKDPVPVLDRPFHVKVNQSAIIESASLEIRFKSVPKDSRCIPVVECFWPEAKAEVLISAVDTNSGEELPLELVLWRGDDDLATRSFGPYSVTLVELLPERTGRPIDASEYAVVLLVSGPPIDESPVSYEQVRVVLGASPVEGMPLTIRFNVDITGMESNSRELYCQPETWEFGDGGKDQTSLIACGDWPPSIKIISKHSERTYTYRVAGSYEVAFTYGPLAPETITIQVR